jgi:hypothetical protein
MTLKELHDAGNYSTDKETTHQYLNFYESLFATLRDKELNLLEVGYGSGGSIRLWEDYFINAHITCIDIINVASHHSGRVKIYMKDINDIDPDFFTEKFDIAIDDGSHYAADQINFINLIYPCMNPGGLIIIEDVHNIEQSERFFRELDISLEIIDLRALNGRYDNVLILIRK